MSYVPIIVNVCLFNAQFFLHRFCAFLEHFSQNNFFTLDFLIFHDLIAFIARNFVANIKGFLAVKMQRCILVDKSSVCYHGGHGLETFGWRACGDHEKRLSNSPSKLNCPACRSGSIHPVHVLTVIATLNSAIRAITILIKLKL